MADEDVDHLYALDNDPQVMRWLNGGETVTREYVTTVLLPGLLEDASSHPGFGFFAAERKDTHHFIGWFSLRPPETGSGHPSFGVRLMRSAWHQGFGLEGGHAVLSHAWATLECPAVEATTYEHNLSSRALLGRLGFGLLERFDYAAAPGTLSPTCFASPGPPWPGKDLRFRILRPQIRSST